MREDGASLDALLTDTPVLEGLMPVSEERGLWERGSGKVCAMLIDCSRREGHEAHRSRVGTEDRVNAFLFTEA